MVRVVKTRAGGTWTEARYFGFIRSGLRRMTMKYPVKQQVLMVNRKKNDGRFDKRTKFIYTCEICRVEGQGKTMEVDHINPAGSLKCYADLPGFVERLFCEIDNLRVICKGCHTTVTKNSK